ncbi:MAG: hypothetical protein ACR2LK_13530 [Solirubrobacteraceae bacterium]
MKPSAPHTIATGERPQLADDERAARLASIAERLRSPQGLDRDALERVEQLPGDE